MYLLKYLLHVLWKYLLHVVRMITNGRPMTLVQRHLFTDVVDGTIVNMYVDYRNRYWLANYAWSGFRVERTDYHDQIAQRAQTLSRFHLLPPERNIP